MVKRSDKIIVSSIKVKNELSSMYRYIEGKIIVLPFGIPYDMKKSKQNKRKKYFLYVGMDHPIKNIEFIKNAFTEFIKNKKYADFKLYILTKNISRKKLKKLYQKAAALLTSSHYESFNFPVLEALSQRCPVIALKSSIIPEMTKYVNLAENMSEFISLMDRLIKNKTNGIDISSLKKQFNWKNYAERKLSGKER